MVRRARGIGIPCELAPEASSQQPEPGGERIFAYNILLKPVSAAFSGHDGGSSGGGMP